MSATSSLHILEQFNYSHHHLVNYPAKDLSPLAPSSIRLRPRILGLTTNNFSYARLGHVMGWWDIYPIPADTPAPYNDTSKYCRIAAWGYAEIVESTVSDILVGHTVYGFLTTATLPFDVTVKQTGMKNQIYVTDPHRQHVWTIYNRYQLCPPLSEIESTKSLDYMGWDSLMQGLFATSYNLSTYGFAWEDENRIHPWGEGEWTAEDANLDDATVVILNASGKTGMSFAYMLRQNRPKEHQPRLVIGVGSSVSKETIESSGFYDKAVLNSDAQALKAELEKSPPRRVVLLDFGARSGAQEEWNAALSSTSIPYLYIGVGGEVKPLNPEEATKRLQKMSGGIVVHASNLREKGIDLDKDDYFKKFYGDFDEFKRKGGIPGMKLVWGEGIEGWTKGWDALCKDEISSKTGLVYRV